MKKYVPFLMVVCAVGVMLCAGETFAAPTDVKELKSLTEMAEGLNKTASWVAGGTALTIGAIYSMVKQNAMALLSSVVISLAAYKGTALLTTAGMLI